jgi:hypothetical protein
MTAIRTQIICLVAIAYSVPVFAGPLDGKWSGDITCARLSFTTGTVKVPMSMTVSDNKATYNREVLNHDGSRVVGTEEGSGTVAPDGAISIAATWKSATEGARYNYTASYSGKLTGGQGKLSGTQVWTYDGKSENRSCSIVLKH